jgi:hypothetical protein
MPGAQTPQMQAMLAKIYKPAVFKATIKDDTLTLVPQGTSMIDPGNTTLVLVRAKQ